MSDQTEVEKPAIEKKGKKPLQKKTKRYNEEDEKAKTVKPYKKKAKRYYEEEKKPKAKTLEKTTVFKVQNKKISEWKLAKWKKRRMPKDETDAQDAKPKLSKKKRQKKEKERRGAPFEHGEETGYVKFDSDEEENPRLTQTEIVEAVDVTSATKHFELLLKDFGPYTIDYNRSGRHLLLAGKRGHMAAFDWQTKRLHCEFNAMETVNSVKWLHQETLFAAAQRGGVCVYDNQGVEVHALTGLDAVVSMEFLPYHMLLVTANEKGFLGYTDVSMGTRVASICTGLGRLDVMTHNPSNAVVLMGHSPGTVTMWTPSIKTPVMKMLCHKAPITAVTVDSTGNYLATSSLDRRVKVFDLRTYKPLTSTQQVGAAASLSFSQTGLLAAGTHATVQVYRNVCREGVVASPYLSHRCLEAVRRVQFCPFEDVLGVGHARGFSSLLVPGAGEADIDAMEVNPYATKKQRQNAEVKLLLDKLQPEMIGLTNWVKEMSSKSGQTEPGIPQPLKGKKQQEQALRERRRQAAASRADKGDNPGDPADVLSRFKKR